MFLPLYPGMANEETDFVIERLNESPAERSAL
jgi:hypothetical protein